MSIAFAAFNTALGLLFPLGMLLYVLVHKRHLLRPFLLGVVTIVLFNLVPTPLVGLVLNRIPGVTAFRSTHALAYMMLWLGFSALLFIAGQYLILRLLLKGHTSWADGVVFGLGSGCVEALYMGLTNLWLLLFQTNLRHIPPAEVAAASFERVFALLLMACLTLLTLQAVRRRQPLRILLSMLIMFATNFTVQILVLLNLHIWLIEGILAGISLLLLAAVLLLRRKEM